MGLLSDEVTRAQNKYSDGDEREVPNRWRALPLYLRGAMGWVFWVGLALTVGLGSLNDSGPLVTLAVEFLTSIGWAIVLAWVLAVAIDKLVITLVGR